MQNTFPVRQRKTNNAYLKTITYVFSIYFSFLQYGIRSEFLSMIKRICEIFCTQRHLSTNNLKVEIILEIVFKCALFVLRWRTGNVFCTDKNVLLRDVDQVDSFNRCCCKHYIPVRKGIRRMSFLLMFMGTALIYPQSGARGLFKSH